MLKFIISSILSVLFAGLIFGAWLYVDMQKTLDEPMKLDGETMIFTVKSGDNMKRIAQRLSGTKAYDNAALLSFTAKMRKIDSKVHAGEYQITSGMTPNDFLTVITQGKVIQYNVILVEGLTFRQYLTKLAAEEGLKKELTGLTDKEIMAKIGQPDQHPEGRFYPDNYFYTTGSSDLDILKRAHKAMEKVVNELWEQREEGLPYKTAYEAQIMASIVEKETGKASERPTIAGVFVRRLHKDMKLQTDPTIVYGVGPTFDGNITRKHLRTDTPYNTYTRKGLPPTPIAMFGTASLKAALHPEKGDALFFVAKGDGSHYFSATYKEHNKAVRKYQLKR